MPDGVTRRAALTRFAALAGGVVAAGVIPGSAQAAVAGGFDDRRRTIFRALVAAYDGEGPITTSGRDLTAELARRYANRDSEFRAWVDALLDAVDVADAGPRFSERAVNARQTQLRGWVQASEPADKLLYRPRPSDANEPTDLVASNDMHIKAIKEFMASLPEHAKKLDPVTGLSNYQPATPEWPKITDGLGPTGTPVRVRRQLSHSAYVLVASFFVPDTRSLTIEAFG